MKPLPELAPLADLVVGREADQDVRGRIMAFDRLASAVHQVPVPQRHQQANKTTQQVSLALIREARARLK